MAELCTDKRVCVFWIAGGHNGVSGLTVCTMQLLSWQQNVPCKLALRLSML